MLHFACSATYTSHVAQLGLKTTHKCDIDMYFVLLCAWSMQQHSCSCDSLSVMLHADQCLNAMILAGTCSGNLSVNSPSKGGHVYQQMATTESMLSAETGAPWRTSA